MNYLRLVRLERRGNSVGVKKSQSNQSPFIFNRIIRIATICVLPALLLGPFQNCQPFHHKGQTDESSLDLANIRAQQAMFLLETKCASCHSASSVEPTPIPDILDIQFLIDNDHIKPGEPQNSPLYLSLIDGIMPPENSGVALLESDVELMRDWIIDLADGGVIDIPGGGNNPPPPPPPPPATPATFTQIRAIIQARCISCHQSGSGNGGLANYTQVRSYVTPGSTAGSEFYTRVASNNMPQGGGPLTAQQKSQIASWINAGAPNN